MTVRDIITEWIKKNGYTGLSGPDDCWCDVSKGIGCDCCMNCEPERLGGSQGPKIEAGQKALFD